MRIYLDLDGVTANFLKAACRLCGVKYPNNYVFGDCWLEHQLCWDDVCDGFKTVEFWESLEVFPWTDKLREICADYDPDYSILTKSMDCAECFHGKYNWVEKHLGRHENLIIVRDCKSRCCGGITDVLIDDNLHNVKRWSEAGGTAFRWIEVSDDYHDIEARLVKLKAVLDNIQMYEELCVN